MEELIHESILLLTKSYVYLIMHQTDIHQSGVFVPMFPPDKRTQEPVARQ